MAGQHPTDLVFVPPPPGLRPLGLNSVQPPPLFARFMSPLPPLPQPQPQQQQDQSGDDEGEDEDEGEGEGEDEDEDKDEFSLVSYILNL